MEEHIKELSGSAKKESTTKIFQNAHISNPGKITPKQNFFNHSPQQILQEERNLIQSEVIDTSPKGS